MVKQVFCMTSVICAILCAHGGAKKTLKVHNVRNNNRASSTESIYVTRDYFSSKVAQCKTRVRFTNDPKKASKIFYFTTFSDSDADIALEYTDSASSADVVYNFVDNWDAAKYRVYIVNDNDEATYVDYTLCITNDKDAANVKIGEKFSTSIDNQRRTAIMYALGFFW